MRIIERLHRVDPFVFNRYCAIVALIFLVLTTTGKMIWRFHSHFAAQDFPQYYMAGVVADHGDWDSLYPIPKPGSPRNPGFVEDSDPKPRYEELAAERGVGEEVRYMQPPPFAVLLMPLGLLSFRSAFVIWNSLNCLFAWAIAVQAGRIFGFCAKRATHASGWIILLIAVSPETHRWVRIQNVSPLMGWLLGLAAIQLLAPHRPMKDLKSALAVCVAGMAKYIGIGFVPLYLAMRRWRTLLFLITTSIVFLAICICISGWGVYHEFIHVIAPTLGRSNILTGNSSLPGFALRMLHQETLTPTARLILTTAQILVFLLLMILLFIRPVSFWQEPAHVFAAIAALTLWMMLFAPISWDHYTAYIAPFYGWLIWEATRGRVRLFIATLVIAIEYVPTAIFTNRIPEPIASHMVWGLCIMLGLAVWRLADPIRVAPDETTD